MEPRALVDDGVSPGGLSRRERQIMDVIYARQQATAQEVLQAIADAPSYSAVRALLRILEDKGHIHHHVLKGKYIYAPVRHRKHAGRGALRGVLRTFYDNSAVQAVAALLDVADANLSDDDLNALSKMIDDAKKRGNKT